MKLFSTKKHPVEPIAPHRARGSVYDPERIHADHQTDMLEVSKTVIELFRSIGVPFEYCHAGPELAGAGQLALFRAVLPVDRVAAMVDGSALIPEALNKKAGAVNAPGVVGARADIRPAQTLFR